MNKRDYFHFVAVFALSLGLGFAIRSTCFSIHKISGNSMLPTFSDGAFLLTIEKPLMKMLGIELKRGDILIVAPKGMPSVTKRLMGLHGEEVWLNDFKVFINGIELKEGFSRRLKNKIDCGNTEVFSVPADQFFLMGDNLCESFDSRFFGTVKLDEIEGKVVWTLYQGDE